MQAFVDWLNTVKASLGRTWDWLIYVAILLGAIFLVAPQQLTVVLYKVALVVVAAVLAYMADRFLYRRFKQVDDDLDETSILDASRVVARALVFLAVVLGLTLGV